MPDLQSILVPNEVMKQIGVDLCNIQEIVRLKHVTVCIDYFSKWSDAKVVINKSETTITIFLYEVICCHWCIRI